MQEILTVFGIDWRLLLIQMFNFGIMLLVLWYFLYRPVIAIIDKRKEKIEQGIKDAQESEKRLSEINKRSDEILGEATKKGTEIIHQSKKRAEEKEVEIISEAKQRANATIEDAKAIASETKERAIKESEEKISQLAILAAEKIIREKL